MSSIINNNTVLTLQQQQQQQLVEQQIQDAAQRAQQQQQAQNRSGNAESSGASDASSSSQSNDPVAYQQAYDAAIKQGLKPAQAKLQANAVVKQAAKDETTQSKATGGQAATGQADGVDNKASGASVGKKAYVAANASASTTAVATTQPSNLAGTDVLETSSSADNYGAAGAGSGTATATGTAGLTDGLTKAAQRSAVRYVATTNDTDMTEANTTSSGDLGEVTKDADYKSLFATGGNAQTTSTTAKDPSTYYSTIMANDPSVDQDTASDVATTLGTSLTPDADGNVDAGSLGTIALGKTYVKLAAASTTEQRAVANLTQQVLADPTLATKLANATSTDEVSKIVSDAITQETIDSMTPTDENGNKVTSTSSKSGGKSKATMSLSPMEMVMMAMMNAAVESQKDAASLADEVQQNTTEKQELREAKSKFSTAIANEKDTDTTASSKKATATTDAQNSVENQSIDSLKSTSVTGNYYKDQAIYDKLSSALDSAGDDSSILMIKLQTASQIVTTFLQACSNVSKGVTDTTKAVISNIGH